jgi:hypothetical protein
MTCATCHANYNATASIVQFDHGAMPTGTKCVYCHVTNSQVLAPNLNLQQVAPNHQGGVSPNKDCTSCHNPRYPTYLNGVFSGGSI